MCYKKIIILWSKPYRQAKLYSHVTCIVLHNNYKFNLLCNIIIIYIIIHGNERFIIICNKIFKVCTRVNMPQKYNNYILMLQLLVFITISNQFFILYSTRMGILKDVLIIFFIIIIPTL